MNSATAPLAPFFDNLRKLLPREIGQPAQPGRLEYSFPPGFVFPFSQADALPLFPRFFWRARHSTLRHLALTSVRQGKTPSLPKDGFTFAGDVLYGGAAFSSETSRESQDDSWKGFTSACWFLPGLEIVASPEETRLVIRWEDSPPLEALQALETFLNGTAHSDSPAIPKARTRSDSPNFHGWQISVERALALIDSGALEKIVLARRSTFELNPSPAPFAILEALAERTPDCFHFLFAPGPDFGTFLGASPEMLYSRCGNRLQTEAVAGTRPRNLDPAEEKRMEAELLDIEKERHEHQIVVDELASALHDLCTETHSPPAPHILKLQRVQHLRTPLGGTLLPEITDDDILARLHPTPATCGKPTSAALASLPTLEPFARGWYAGPVGRIGGEETLCCVAIRSLLLRASVLDAYAGAGIVPGSDAEKEWSELESKIGGLLRILSP